MFRQNHFHLGVRWQVCMHAHQVQGEFREADQQSEQWVWIIECGREGQKWTNNTGSHTTAAINEGYLPIRDSHTWIHWQCSFLLAVPIWVFMHPLPVPLLSFHICSEDRDIRGDVAAVWTVTRAEQAGQLPKVQSHRGGKKMMKKPLGGAYMFPHPGR